MKTKTVIYVAMMFLITGCGTRTYFHKTDLVYNQNNSNTAHISGNNAVIYIKKPDTDILKNFAESNNIKNEYSKRFKAQWNESNAIVGQYIDHTSGFLRDDIQEFHYTNDDVGDWIAGALGTELSSIGYSVRYVKNFPESVDNSIIIKANKIFSTLEMYPMRGFWCRGVIDLDISLLKNGIASKEFNVKNESDFPEYAKDGSWDQEKNNQCYTVALRDTMGEVLKQALPVIVKTFGGL